MKKTRLAGLIAAIVIALTSMASFAQNPVKWTAKAEMTSDTEGTFTLTADMEEGWHIYGTQPTDDGPINTQIVFGGTSVKWDARTYVKPKATEMEDPVFECTVNYWEKKVTFTRKFTVTDPAKASVYVKVTYMCCNDESCRPPVTEELKPTIEK